MKFIEIAAEAIIDKLKTILDQDVAVTDLVGNIIADSELKYFGTQISAAQRAINQNQAIKVDQGEMGTERAAWITPLVYDNEVIGTLIIKDAGKTTEDKIPLARSLAELLIHQLMVLRHLPTTPQVLDKFFYDLLEGAELDKQKVIEQSKFLDAHYYQARLEDDRVVLVINFPGFWQKVLGGNIVPEPEKHSQITHYKQVLAEVFKPETQRGGEVLSLYFSGDSFLVLISDPHDASMLADKLGSKLATFPKAITQRLKEENVKIALAPFYPGLSGLTRAYEEAKNILQIGQKLYPDRTVFMAGDVLLAKTIDKIPVEDQQVFVKTYLEGILDETSLLDTLEAYFAADLNLKDTANKLIIHKNTLYYRFEKIKKIIGLDPRSFHTAVKLELALLMHKLSSTPPNQST